MQKWLPLAASSTLAMLAAGAVSAQDALSTDSTIFGTGTAASQIDDLREQIEDDAERNPIFTSRAEGMYGSAALRAVQSTSSDAGVDDVTTVGLGLQFGLNQGPYGQELNLSYTFAETNGVTNRNELQFGYDFTYSFTPRFFAFSNVDVKWDNLAETADQIYRDGYLGIGAGYRVIDTANATFDVKAGPGYRYIEDGTGADISEAAYSLGASYNQRISSSVALYDDLSLIGSDSNTTVINEFGVNVALNNALSLQTSLRSTFSGDDFDGLENTGTTTGVAVVYSFN